MDDKAKASLRKKRSVRGKISSPKQISAPMPAGAAALGLGAASMASQSSLTSQSQKSLPLEPASGRPPGSSGSGSVGRVSESSTTREGGGGPPPSAAASARRPGPRERPPPVAGKTSDLVKRRYSTRFTQLPPDFGAGGPGGAGRGPPVPGVPNIPSQFADGAPPSRDGRPSAEGKRVKVDTKALRDPNLKPEHYVASILADATESDIRNYQNDLRKIKNRTSTDLQHNVYQNRTQFIRISKEAERLKGEMRTLRTLMSELTGALGQVTISAKSGADGPTASNGLSPHDAAARGGSDGRARRQANRSSVANLEALWNSHLQTLWKRVEGSQKFLPASPGRHIVYESGRWVELNAATWKARRRVHLILLNDHLLIAAEKKRAENGSGPNGSPKPGQPPAAPPPSQQQQQPQKQLAALRCWPLQDVQIADLGQKGGSSSGSSASANAVNVRVGAESFTYAVSASAADEKAALLTNFRKAAEELRKSAEAESQRRSRQPADTSLSYFATRDTTLLQRQPTLLSGLSAAGGGGSNDSGKGQPDPSGPPSRSASASSATSLAPGGTGSTGASMPLLVDGEGKQRDFRWLEGQLDELDIEIALQRSEAAVGRVERLQRLAGSIQAHAAAQELVRLKVGERAARLARAVTRQLALTHAWATATRQNVGWLVRLGYEDLARETYLGARGEVLRKRVRQTLFDGDLPTYLHQTSFITFVLVRNTLATYQLCFPPLLLSAAVKWAKDRVDDFNVLLARQLSSVEPGGDVWSECLAKARAHADLLAEVGVDFSGLIGGVESAAAAEDRAELGLGLK